MQQGAPRILATDGGGCEDGGCAACVRPSLRGDASPTARADGAVCFRGDQRAFDAQIGHRQCSPILRTLRLC